MERFANLTREAIFGLFKPTVESILKKRSPVWKRAFTDDTARKAARVPDPDHEAPHPLKQHSDWVRVRDLDKIDRVGTHPWEMNAAHEAWIYSTRNRSLPKDLVYGVYKMFVAYYGDKVFKQQVKYSGLGTGDFFNNWLYIASRLKPRERKALVAWFKEYRIV